MRILPQYENFEKNTEVVVLPQMAFSVFLCFYYFFSFRTFKKIEAK